MNSRRAEHFLESLILGLVFYAANTRGLIVSALFPLNGAWIEVAAEFALVLCSLWILHRLSLLKTYQALWVKNWPLLLFIFVAVASLLWTIDPVATLARVVILVFSSMLGAYLMVRYQLPRVLILVANFFAVLVVLSIVVALVWPDIGMMNFYPYYGSWRGIFWHRNYLGSTMALGTLIFLLSLILSHPRSKKQAILYGTFYLLSLMLVVLSKSVTGLVLAIVLHIILLAVVLWLRFHSKLHRAHYWVLSGLFAVFLIVGYVKLDFLLGLLNRNSTFTGRTGLWIYLIDSVVSKRPFFGYGFGALWAQESFRLQLRDALGWLYPVVIGDNGYIDILLHLGMVGLIVFVAMLTFAVIQSAKLAFGRKNLLAFVPLLVMAYMLFANITLSYFLETESFTWMVMIVFLFAPLYIRQTEQKERIDFRL